MAIRSDAGFVMLRAGQAGMQELFCSGRCFVREWGRYFVTGVREMVCCRSAGDVLLRCIVFCIHDPPQHKIALFGYHECMPIPHS